VAKWIQLLDVDAGSRRAEHGWAGIDLTSAAILRHPYKALFFSYLQNGAR
jgi:hypothetical protein